MQYHVDDLTIFEGDKYCRCKKRVFIAVSSNSKKISERMLFINVDHVTTYTRSGNSFTVGTREGYLKLSLQEFNIFFEPTKEPEEVYTKCNIIYASLHKESFNKITGFN